MKKQIIALLIVSLLVIAFSVCFAASKFPDTVNTKYDTAVEKLTSTKVVTGYPDGTFKPGDPITRAEICVMLVNSLGLKKATDLPMLKFSDINLQDKKHWGYDWIKIAVENNIIVGYPDGTFGPDKQVTYAECEAMILRALKLESAMSDKTWPTGYMNEASKQGLLTNVTYSDANAAANRGEVAVSFYNMVVKVEKQKAEEELAKAEAEKKAEEEAKKNALDWSIVSSVSDSKNTYYIRFYDDKTKYELYSIGGSTKLTDSKIDALKENVVGYKEGKNGIETSVTYKPASFDSAKVITKVDGYKVTYKDKSTWDTSNTNLKDKYKLYTFIRVTASADDDDELITFEKVVNLGLGINSSVKFVKGERVLVDDTNKVIVFLKGIDSSATIKKGKINGTGIDTSDYEYGWVKKVTSKSKVDYVEIGKEEYDAYKKDTFEEDEYAVYTIYQENSDDNDVIKYVKSYGVKDLDGSAKIVKSVSNYTKVTYTDNTTVDYGSSSNIKKYEDYHVVEVDVKEVSSELEVKDYDVDVDFEDVEFKAGDRTIIDTKYEVFMIFHGLSSSDNYKDGKYYVATQYTVKYNWKTGSDLGVLTKPDDKTVTSGTSVTVWKPTVPEGYTLTLKKGTSTLTQGSSLKITANTTIDIYLEKNKTPLEKAYDDMQAALTAWNNAKTDEANKKTAMENASGDVATAQTAYDTADEEYQAAKEAFEDDDGSDPDVTAQLLETMNAKAEIRSSKKSILDSKKTTFNNAKSAYINAQKTTANKEAAYEEAKAAWMALAEE